MEAYTKKPRFEEKYQKKYFEYKDHECIKLLHVTMNLLVEQGDATHAVACVQAEPRSPDQPLRQSWDFGISHSKH